MLVVRGILICSNRKIKMGEKRMRNIYYTLRGTKKYSNLFMAYDALPTEKRIQNIDNWLDRWIMLNERG